MGNERHTELENANSSKQAHSFIIEGDRHPRGFQRTTVTLWSYTRGDSRKRLANLGVIER